MGSRIGTQISVDEIKQNPSAFLRRVQAGEAFVIVTAGNPLAEIKPVTWSDKLLRPVGLCAGEFDVPEDFDAPLPDDIVQEFEGQ